MTMRFFDAYVGLIRLAMLVLLIGGSMAITVAQPNGRAPRLENPDLVTAERSVQAPARLQPVYDKAKDETTYFISSLLVISESAGREVQVQGESQKRYVSSSITKMVVYYKSPGKTKTTPTDIVIAINAGSASGFEFKEHREFSIVLPDQEIDLGQMQLISQKDDGFRAYGFIRYWETLEIPVKLDVYKKALESKSVTLKIGGGSTRLTGSQLKELRKFAKDLE